MDLMNRYKLYLMAYAALISGFGSLICFAVFLSLGPFHIVDIGLEETGSLVVDAALSFVFFLQHSLMIRKGIRDRLTHVFPDNLYPAFYAITSGMALLLAMGFWQEVPRTVISIAHVPHWVFGILSLGAVAGFIWGVRSLKRAFDPFGIKKIRSLIKSRQMRPVPLSEMGAYRWMRHPLYFFSLIIIWACPMLTPDRLLFNILWSAWIIIGTFLEERDLIAEFGDQYREYQSRVPMLIPYRIPHRFRGIAKQMDEPIE